MLLWTKRQTKKKKNTFGTGEVTGVRLPAFQCYPLAEGWFFAEGRTCFFCTSSCPCDESSLIHAYMPAGLAASGVGCIIFCRWIFFQSFHNMWLCCVLRWWSSWVFSLFSVQLKFQKRQSCLKKFEIWRKKSFKTEDKITFDTFAFLSQRWAQIRTVSLCTLDALGLSHEFQCATVVWLENKLVSICKKNQVIFFPQKEILSCFTEDYFFTTKAPVRLGPGHVFTC